MFAKKTIIENSITFEIKEIQNISDSSSTLQLKYSKVGKSCHSEGVVQWSSDDINGACTEDAVGLGFEVACDFKSMHIAAQSNDIQFCWVAGQISNNEYWAIDHRRCYSHAISNLPFPIQKCHH